MMIRFLYKLLVWMCIVAGTLAFFGVLHLFNQVMLYG